jgi:DNA-binding transcriptional MerR regulator
MTTTEILKLVPIPRHKLYYLEQKGFVSPRKNRSGDVEFRDWTSDEAEKLQVIWKYLQEGFKYRVAERKAYEELNSRRKRLVA